jgi:two-component system, chemotaxis family, protein-glutamate methylesterase/glutaminase
MKYQLIAMGVSAGGLTALSSILQTLPEDFPLPIVVVQHRAKESDALALVLQSSSRLRICEIEDKMSADPGKVYIAPPDYHVLMDRGHLALSVDEPVTYSRPSIDVLFESVADECGAAAIGVILTGANRDGAHGLRRIKDAGGYVIVQDPNTAEVPYMPRAALEQVPDAQVLTLSAIGPQLRRLAKATSKANV